MRKWISAQCLRCMLLGLAALSGALATAAVAPPVAADAALEHRVLALSENLRCLVCQNQTIAESHADLAIDLKNQVREQLAQGRSEQQVLDYMVARYGDFVLYRPPFKAVTWLLWCGPALLLVAGMALLIVQLRRLRGAEPELADADLARVAALLGGPNPVKEPS